LDATSRALWKDDLHVRAFEARDDLKFAARRDNDFRKRAERITACRILTMIRAADSMSVTHARWPMTSKSPLVIISARFISCCLA